MSPPLIKHLESAVSAIDRADYAGGLEHLLAAWANTRSPSIASVAELIDRCVLGSTAERPPSLGVDSFLAADAIERGAYLRRLSQVSVTEIADPMAWLKALRELPPDPRVPNVLDKWSDILPLVLCESKDDMEDPAYDLNDPLTAAFEAVCRRHLDWRIQHLDPLEPAKPKTLSEEWVQKLRAVELRLRQQLL